MMSSLLIFNIRIRTKNVWKVTMFLPFEGEVNVADKNFL